jgi:hypothetical protein
MRNRLGNLILKNDKPIHEALPIAQRNYNCDLLHFWNNRRCVFILQKDLSLMKVQMKGERE